MNTKLLAAALRIKAGEVRDVNHDADQDDEQDDIALHDGATLLRVLANVVEGKPLDKAFGPPGDWGYETEIGRAIASPPCLVGSNEGSTSGAEARRIMKRRYSLDAPDQRRLKIARTEIEAILRKHDLAGVVVLHTPGMTEFFYDVRPSYSCAWIDEGQQMVRFKSLAADYGGDRKTQLQDQAASANLFAALACDLGAAVAMFRHVAAIVDKATGAEHTAASPVPDAMEAKPQ